ncbi:serine hydrolase [Daejeonella sp.]|uniref:serine hydrolase domain-containing protein n=1 Tax=Daejeonella sp. TaxID=2805397 RepID=UPI002730DA15|nr:serine hydrolase [Daejeonella sp.]MDP2413580.1 serine hydrolase [Daejeonella sp.]
MKKIFIVVMFIMSLNETIAQQNQTSNHIKVMDGFPPSRESQVTFDNYREHPFSQWSFRNTGAPMHVLMIPRSGAVHAFKESHDNSNGRNLSMDTEGNSKTFEDIFKDNYADGVIVLKNNTVLYENYWNGLSKDYQHIWFSVSKSLASSAFGILVDQNKVDLSASPAQYIPELKGSAYERATIQDILNMSTALGFQDNYTDTSSFYYKYYGAAANTRYVPGSDSDTKTSEVLGTYDFLFKKSFLNKELEPGIKFEYNSTNVDVISWMISRLTGKPYHDFIRENIWAKIGAEHDSYIVADRSYTAVATGGMNTTLRDAALFGNLILNHGSIDGKQIIPAKWVDETINLTDQDKERYSRNDVYVKAKLPWVAYKNFWWILDETKGEYAAVGIHGQVIYINRSVNVVIAYFSSQPQASSVAGYKPFVSKLNACRELTKKMNK